MKYSKRFTFTLLRPCDEKRLLLDKLPDLLLMVYGWEKGPVSGITHLQGYFETTQEINIFKIRSILKGYYVEIARESRYQNLIYTTKGYVIKKYDPHEILDKLMKNSYTESTNEKASQR